MSLINVKSEGNLDRSNQPVQYGVVLWKWIVRYWCLKFKNKLNIQFFVNTHQCLQDFVLFICSIVIHFSVKAVKAMLQTTASGSFLSNIFWRVRVLFKSSSQGRPYRTILLRNMLSRKKVTMTQWFLASNCLFLIPEVHQTPRQVKPNPTPGVETRLGLFVLVTLDRFFSPKKCLTHRFCRHVDWDGLPVIHELILLYYRY